MANYDDYAQSYLQPNPGMAPPGNQLPPAAGEMPTFSSPEPGAFNPADEFLAEPALIPGAQEDPIAAPATTRTSNSSSSSQSNSSSKSGLNQETLSRVGTTGNKKLDSRVAGRMQGINADAADTATDFATADSAKRSAIEQNREVETKIAEQEAQNFRDEAELNRAMGDKETDENAKSQARVQAALGQHLVALAEYESDSVNPSEMWDNMGSGAKFGNLVSVFISGFLGAKGIDTSIMKTLNEAIDRNIEAQLQNINKKGKVADKFQQVWQMTREQSQSDAEAREKMRTFLSADFKNAAAGKLAAFGTDISTAKASALVAEAEKEKAITLERLRNTRNGTELSISGQEIQRYGQELQASMEAARIAESRAQRLATSKSEQAKAAQEAQDKLDSDVIVDSTPGGENRAWKVRPGTPDKDKAELKNKAANTANVMNLTSQYVETASRLGKGYEGPMAANLRDKDRALAEQLRSNIVAQITRENSGLAVTDAERKMYNDMLSKNSLTSVDGAGKVRTLGHQLSQIRKSSLSESMEVWTVPLNEVEQNSFTRGTRFSDDNIGGDATPKTNEWGAELAVANKVGVEDKQEAVSDNTKLVSSTQNANAEKLGVGDEPERDAWAEFTGSGAKNTFGSNDRWKQTELFEKAKKGDRQLSNETVPQAFLAANQLYTLAKSGDSEAIKSLMQVSDSTRDDVYTHVTGGSTPSDAALFADFYIEKLTNEGLIKPGTFNLADEYLK